MRIPDQLRTGTRGKVSAKREHLGSIPPLEARAAILVGPKIDRETNAPDE